MRKQNMLMKDVLKEMGRLGAMGFGYMRTFKAPVEVSTLNMSVKVLIRNGFAVRTVKWNRSNHGRGATFVALMIKPK